MGLPADAAIWRLYQPPAEAPIPRTSSSLDAVRKIGGKVIEIHRDKVG
jgi:hypothetical protein